MYNDDAYLADYSKKELIEYLGEVRRISTQRSDDKIRLLREITQKDRLLKAAAADAQRERDALKAANARMAEERDALIEKNRNLKSELFAYRYSQTDQSMIIKERDALKAANAKMHKQAIEDARMLDTYARIVSERDEARRERDAAIKERDALKAANATHRSLYEFVYHTIVSERDEARRNWVAAIKERDVLLVRCNERDIRVHGGVDRVVTQRDELITANDILRKERDDARRIVARDARLTAEYCKLARWTHARRLLRPGDRSPAATVIRHIQKLEHQLTTVGATVGVVRRDVPPDHQKPVVESEARPYPFLPYR